MQWHEKGIYLAITMLLDIKNERKNIKEGR